MGLKERKEGIQNKMKTRGGVPWEDTDRDLPWQQSGEDVFLPFFFPNLYPFSSFPHRYLN